MIKEFQINKLVKVILLIILYLSLPLILMFTNPNNLPLPLLVLPVVLLFLIIFVTVYFFVISKMKASKRISKTRNLVITAIVAIVPVLLIVLASIRQFTLRDIILSVFIVVCISWYLLKVDFLKSQ